MAKRFGGKRHISARLVPFKEHEEGFSRGKPVQGKPGAHKGHRATFAGYIQYPVCNIGVRHGYHVIVKCPLQGSTFGFYMLWLN